MRALGLLLVLVSGAILAGCAAKPPAASERVVNVTVGRYFFDPGTNFSINATKGEAIEIRLTSLDVTHGFAITDYGVQTEVPPRQTVSVHVVASKVGDFVIYCTVFCGTGHPTHKGLFHVAG